MAVLALASLAASCGGSHDPPATGLQPSEEAAPTEAGAALAPPRNEPDPAAARERLLANANMITPDAARIVSYRQTGVRFEGPPEMQSAIVSYEAELEFVADTYFQVERKAGDRAQVYGEIEYLNDGGQWRIATMGVFPR